VVADPAGLGHEAARAARLPSGREDARTRIQGLRGDPGEGRGPLREGPGRGRGIEGGEEVRLRRLLEVDLEEPEGAEGQRRIRQRGGGTRGNSGQGARR